MWGFFSNEQWQTIVWFGERKLHLTINSTTFHRFQCKFTQKGQTEEKLHFLCKTSVKLLKPMLSLCNILPWQQFNFTHWFSFIIFYQLLLRSLFYTLNQNDNIKNHLARLLFRSIHFLISSDWSHRHLHRKWQFSMAFVCTKHNILARPLGSFFKAK